MEIATKQTDEQVLEQMNELTDWLCTHIGSPDWEAQCRRLNMLSVKRARFQKRHLAKMNNNYLEEHSTPKISVK